MDLLNDMIKKTFKKLDSGNSDFCGTPAADAKKLSTQLAQSLILGKGNADDLLGNAVNNHSTKCKKGCTH